MLNQRPRIKIQRLRAHFLKVILYYLWCLFSKREDAKRVVSNKRMKIKFEVDINNSSGGETINKYRMLPSPYEIKIFNESPLFAGKTHAIICRGYKNHVKGRDFYDYLFLCFKRRKN